jgi:hypothetical protein
VGHIAREADWDLGVSHLAPDLSKNIFWILKVCQSKIGKKSREQRPTLTEQTQKRL